MATVTVKNIPDKLYARLKSEAEINRRSINSEIIMCIEHAVLSRQINPIKVLENARQLRKLTTNYPIEDEEFNHAKAEGCDGHQPRTTHYSQKLQRCSVNLLILLKLFCMLPL